MKLHKLYSYLVQRANKYQPRFKVSEISQDIPNLPREHLENIFLLIYHHESKDNDDIESCSMPYRSTTVSDGKGILFELSNIPPFLLLIISHYLDYVTESDE
jgi:hypothetical protein